MIKKQKDNLKTQLERNGIKNGSPDAAHTLPFKLVWILKRKPVPAGWKQQR